MTLDPKKPLAVEFGDRTLHFLLSAGGLRRITKKMNCNMQDLLQRDSLEAAVVILWEALQDKPEGMTEDDFAEMLPPDIVGLGKVMAELLNISLPSNPPAAVPVPPTAA